MTVSMNGEAMLPRGRLGKLFPGRCRQEQFQDSEPGH